MAMEIDEAVIRVDNHAEIDEVEPIEISDDEARRVRLYENFYQVNAIDPALYAQHDVKRGLRNADGHGVLAGMTNISNVHGYVMSDGEKMPAEGSLRLRGYDLYDLLGDLDPTRRFAFEEVAYLLLMGELPTQERLNRFVEVIDSQRELPRRVHGQHAYGGHLTRPHEHDGPLHSAPVRGRRVRRGPLARARDSHGALAYQPPAAHHGAGLLRQAGRLQP